MQRLPIQMQGSIVEMQQLGNLAEHKGENIQWRVLTKKPCTSDWMLWKGRFHCYILSSCFVHFATIFLI